MFFLSGVAGLIYEIAWGRLLVVIFGSTTNSIVAVVSAFLGGLAIGSLIFGRLADRMSAKKLVFSYSLLELGVGLTGALSLILIPEVRSIYGLITDGSSQTIPLLIAKFTLTIGIILIPTILMGGTLPILVKFLATQQNLPETTISRLYAINTFGGALGVALAAFALIELFGINQTVLIAVVINLLIALLARSLTHIKEVKPPSQQTNQLTVNFMSAKFLLAMTSFALSGMIGISYQILWTRALTPILGTMVYAFGTILLMYLLGIAYGSLQFNWFLKLVKRPGLGFALCQLGIGLFALASVLTMHKSVLAQDLDLITRILPATILMGLTFPLIAKLTENSKLIGQSLGLIYFANTIGAIIGGFLASFVLIPMVGTSGGIVLLVTLNFILAAIFFVQEAPTHKLASILSLATILLVLTTGWILIFKRDRLHPYRLDFAITDAKLRGQEYLFKEDEVASVFGINDILNKEQHLIIDGVGTTHKGVETKLMAHLPIALNPQASDMLIIAFGMGSTYRSSLLHDINTTVVELVPSIPNFMHLFHQDAQQFLNHPKGKIIINDGRNYAFLTKDKFDIVVIDPPPPFRTAGSTVLHSKEFYQDLAKNLKPNGIVSQWIFYDKSREDEISMAIKSFVEVFPHILAVEYIYNNGGLYLEGSFSPLDPTRVGNISKDPISYHDLKELLGEAIDDPRFQMMEVVADRESLWEVVKDYPAIVDNHPRSEYYIIRHKTTQSPTLVNQDAKNFVNKFRTLYRVNLKN